MPAAPSLAGPAASTVTRPLPAPDARRLKRLVRATGVLLIPDLPPPLPRRLVGDEPVRAMLTRLLTDAVEALCTSDDGEIVGEALWYLFHDPDPARPGGVEAVTEALDLDLACLCAHLEAEARRVGRWIDPDVCRLFADFARRRQAYADYTNAQRARGARSPRRANVRQLLPCAPRGYFRLDVPPIPYTLPVTHRGRAGRLAAAASGA